MVNLSTAQQWSTVVDSGRATVAQQPRNSRDARKYAGRGHLSTIERSRARGNNTCTKLLDRYNYVLEQRLKMLESYVSRDRSATVDQQSSTVEGVSTVGDLLNVVEAAKYCKRSKDVLYKDVKQGKLRVAKVGKRRAFYFTVEDLDAYLSGESTVDQHSSTVEPAVPTTVDNSGQTVFPVFDVSRRFAEQLDELRRENEQLREYVTKAITEQDARLDERDRRLVEVMRGMMEKAKEENNRPWWKRLFGV